MLYLRTLEILSVDTIRSNRIKNYKLPEEKFVMKCARGSSQEFIATIYGIDLTSLSWKDNRIVNLISTYVWTKPIVCETQNESVEPIAV